MILRLAQLLHELKTKFYHYVGSAVSFSIVTSSSSLDDFQPIQKMLTSNGYRVHSWLLECVGTSPVTLETCWATMTAAHAAGDVVALGCVGASAKVLETWPGGAPLSIWAMEMYAGKPLDAYAESRHKQLVSRLRTMGVQCICYNIMGPKNILLADEDFMDKADRAQMDPMMFGVKWAEAQGFAVILPRLSINEESDEQPSKPELDDGVHLEWASDFAQAYNVTRSAETCLKIALSQPSSPCQQQPDISIRRRKSSVVNYAALDFTGSGRRASLPASLPTLAFPRSRMQKAPTGLEESSKSKLERRVSLPVNRPTPPTAQRPKTSLANPRYRKTIQELHEFGLNDQVAGA